MENLSLFTKRSVAIDFFKYHYAKKNRSYLINLIYLVLTPQKELGWVAKMPDTGKLFFSAKRNQETPIDSLKNYKIISPESVFLYKNHLFLYKYNRTTKDCYIVYLKTVNSVTYPERLFPEKDFKFCLVKNQQNQIINCAWVAEDTQLAVFQDEPQYNPKEIVLEPMELGKEFEFSGKKWYTCTEKGKCLLADLPII